MQKQKPPSHFLGMRAEVKEQHRDNGNVWYRVKLALSRLAQNEQNGWTSWVRISINRWLKKVD